MGGVGHDLSYIRPKGSAVNNSALTSTGVVPYMERYSNSTREVAQAGRRGALMLSIDIIHPDAESFIDAKLDGTKITGANVSVKISDSFMKAVVSGSDFIQHYPTDWEHFNQDSAAIGFLEELGNGNIEYDKTYTLAKGFYAKRVDAKKIWDKIVKNAHKSAEPGILFWDKIIRESIGDMYSHLGFNSLSTNPCGSEYYAN